MIKNLLAGVLLMPCCVAWAAAPVVGEVTFSQDANTRIVTAEYTLANGPAFVTAEFIAAGQSIGQPVRAVTGAALSTTDGVEAPLDRIVESGRHSFQWRIDADAPGVSEAARRRSRPCAHLGARHPRRQPGEGTAGRGGSRGA